MRRVRVTRRWWWAVALVSILVGGVVAVVQRDALQHEAVTAVAGGPATTRYPAPGQTSLPTRTRGARAPGRNRPRRTISPAPTGSPAGTPTSASETPGTKVIVGLGDSVPAGANCPGCTTYVDEVGRRYAAGAGAGAVVYNHAVSGYTTSDVLGQLGDATLRRRLARADLVILTIGANDLDTSPLGDPNCAGERLLGCSAQDLASLEDHLRRIEATVREALKPGGRLVVTDYWNVFTDGAVGRAEGPAWVSGSDTLTVRTNALIAGVTQTGGGQFVDVRPAFRGADGSTDCTSLLADDGDHLNAAGHRLMADTILAALGGGR